MSAYRRRKDDSGAPRWMVTFADLMALLFALFVLLLSFAKVDNETFKRHAGPMREAFGVGDKVLRTTSRDFPVPGEAGPGESAGVGSEAAEAGRRARAKRGFVWLFQRSMERELADAIVILVDDGDRIIIRFPDATAFSLGSAALAPDFEPVLARIGSVLRATQGRILVSGHTDNSPIATERFRSNWDLSAARAISVVHHLIDKARIAPGRITAQGYADSRPLAPNDTPANRSKNRRVEIAIEITDWQG
ncbi:MAG TPA: OmpA family protein [Rhodospirillales bacterium]